MPNPPPVGTSHEVLVHHFAEHNKTCASEDGGEMDCPCGQTTALVCFTCHQPLAIAVVPGTWCEHAADLWSDES